ncbi:transcription factor p65 isoform X2 [Bemisia tabaci]|uniref:transcription factor p65 isoform X2 n=1 Tax=Bemisia tabaci TaxID=7038 RepID=UPI003B288122
MDIFNSQDLKERGAEVLTALPKYANAKTQLCSMRRASLGTKQNKTASSVSTDFDGAKRFPNSVEVITDDLRNQEEAALPQVEPMNIQPSAQPGELGADLGNLGGQGAPPGISIQIVEQPASQEVRFRYECEGRSAGSIPGVNSTPENKTYPTVKINGYRGRVVVVVSCVTKDYPHKAHPHKLVGKEGCKRGICTVEVNNESMTASFPNLGIQCIKRKDMVAALEEREKIKVDPFRMGFSHKNQVNTIDLNVVRFCFQAFFRTNQWVTIPPVVSEPIYDKKAMSNLQICRICPPSASVLGGTEVILTCEKVTRDDIEVWIYEKNSSGEIVWEEKTEFQPQDVHHQYAIAFRLPTYKSLEVENPVQAYLELRRPSDQASSVPRPFQLTPLDADPVHLKRKRRRQQSTDSKLSDSSFYRGSAIPGTNTGGIPNLTIKREPEFSPVYNPGYPNVQSPSLYAASASRSPSVYAPSTSRTPSPGMDYHHSPGSQNFGMAPGSHMMDGVMTDQPSAVINETINASHVSATLHYAGGQMYTNPEPQNDFSTSAALNNLGGMNPSFPDYTPLSRVTGQNVYNIESQNTNYVNLDTPTQGVENSISSLPESISNINLSDYIPNRMTDSTNSMMDSFSKYLNSTIQELPDVDNNNQG